MLPFLASFVLGVVDAGRGFQLKSRVTSAAREGATVAQYTPGRVNCVGRDVTDVANGEGTLPANSTVVVQNMTTGTTYTSVACTGVSAGGQRVRVTVSAPLTLYSPLFASLARADSMPVNGYADVVVQGESV